jgi:hypothetical protein
VPAELTFPAGRGYQVVSSSLFQHQVGLVSGDKLRRVPILSATENIGSSDVIVNSVSELIHWIESVP